MRTAKKEPAGGVAHLRQVKLKKVLHTNLANNSMEIKIGYQVDPKEGQRCYEGGCR